MIINDTAPSTVLFAIPIAATAVFLVDMLGPYSPETAALFVPLILLSIWAFSATGVAYTGVVAFVMTIASYILSRNEGFDRTNAQELLVILAVLAITTALSVGISRRMRRT